MRPQNSFNLVQSYLGVNYWEDNYGDVDGINEDPNGHFDNLIKKARYWSLLLPYISLLGPLGRAVARVVS